jgi:hypothetical protein
VALNFLKFLRVNYFWFGIPAGFILLRGKPAESPNNLFFVIITTVFYISATVLPANVTDRTLLPATAVLSIIGVPAAMLLANSLSHRGLRISLLASICAFILIHAQVPTWKREAVAINRRILQALHGAGMSRSSEVFSNDYEPYNLDDAYLTPFYDYGGYMLLDSEYREQRPMPTASTPWEWNRFFAIHHIRYLVIRRGTDLDYFAEQGLVSNCKMLAETKLYRVAGWDVSKLGGYRVFSIQPY